MDHENQVEDGGSGESPKNQRVVDLLFGGEQTGQAAKKSVKYCERRQIAGRAVTVVGEDLWGFRGERQWQGGRLEQGD